MVFGTIEFEAKLTGTLYLREITEGEPTPYGSLVAPGVNGMVHEHYFNIRLDMSVDGDANTVVEMQADRVPSGPDNPHGNAHGVSESVILKMMFFSRVKNTFWAFQKPESMKRINLPGIIREHFAIR